MQFSLKWLLIAVAFVAVSTAGLLNASETWRVGLRSVAVLTVLIAIVGTARFTGKERAFCSGYALVVVSYIGSQWLGLEPLTTKPLAFIHAQLFRPVTEDLYPPIDPSKRDSSVFMSPKKSDGSVVVTYIRPTRDRFIFVGDTILSVLVGFLGGLIATAFYQRRLTKLTETARQSSS